MSLVGRFHNRAVFGRRVRVLTGHLARLIPQEARLLDVGCGDGALASRIMELRPDVEIVGIDVLVRPQPQIPVQPFDGVEIPYDDASFGAVMLVDVLHHTDDPTVLLREAARVAPGAVIIKDHLADGVLAVPTLRLMDWVGNAHHGVAMPFNYWPATKWRRAFQDLDLVTEEWTSDLGLYPRPASWVFDRGLHVVCRLSAGH